VEATLPDSRIAVMAGQGHVAMDTGTDLFTTEVLRFLTSEGQQVSASPQG
jgi:hypothetical protein